MKEVSMEEDEKTELFERSKRVSEKINVILKEENCQFYVDHVVKVIAKEKKEN
jgi:hypothetical protein